MNFESEAWRGGHVYRRRVQKTSKDGIWQRLRGVERRTLRVVR